MLEFLVLAMAIVIVGLVREKESLVYTSGWPAVIFVTGFVTVFFFSFRDCLQ